MGTSLNLTNYAEKCLNEFGSRYPQYIKGINPSIFDEGEWQIDIPWPNGNDHAGLRISTRKTNYGEILRIDLGNWDQEYSIKVYKNNLSKLLDEAFTLLNDIFSERTVLIEKWINPHETIDKFDNPEYTPSEDNQLYGAKEIWMRSWLGTYNREWKL